MKKSVMLVLMVLAIPFALGITLPTSPPGAPSSGEIPEILMVLDFTNITESPFEVNVSHTGNKTYPFCEVQVDATPVTELFEIDEDEIENVTVEGAPGDYVLTGICANDSAGNEIIRADIGFKIVGGNLHITSPKEGDTVNSAFDVMINHTGSSSMSCYVEIYDENTMGSVTYDGDSFVLAPNTRKTVAFGNPVSLSDDDYLIRARCEHGLGGPAINATSIVVTVDEDSGTTSGGDYAIILMDPDAFTLDDDDFDVKFFHNFTSRANCTVSIDGDEKDEINNLLYNSPRTFSYDLWQGLFDFNVSCTNQTFAADLIFALEIDLNESNSTNSTNNTTPEDPIVTISGKTGTIPNITEGDVFTILGRHFTPGNTVKIWVSGNGKSNTYLVNVSSSGDFSLTVDEELKPGSYKITVRNQDHSNEFDTLNFLIVRDKSEIKGWEEKEEESSTTTTTTPTKSNNGVNNPSGSNPTGANPIVENPIPIEPESGGWWFWVLIPFIAFIVVTGGLMGFLAYRGDLDLSSWEGFQNSFQELIGGSGTSSGSGSVASMNASEKTTIRSFVNSERSKGFDDLTIRSALLARGWEKSHVDQVFDELYTGGRNDK